jgi:hypothetical protein
MGIYNIKNQIEIVGMRKTKINTGVNGSTED